MPYAGSYAAMQLCSYAVGMAAETKKMPARYSGSKNEMKNDVAMFLPAGAHSLLLSVRVMN